MASLFIRRLTGIAVLFAALAAAHASAQILPALEGEWRGEELSLAIDQRRGQARLDLGRPFHWERFILKEVDGERIVFTIGARLFAATLDDDSLSVEAPGYGGPQLLRRVPADAAPTVADSPAEPETTGAIDSDGLGPLRLRRFD